MPAPYPTPPLIVKGRSVGGHAPANFAACRNACLGLVRRAGYANVAAALRRHACIRAMYPRKDFALLGIR